LKGDKKLTNNGGKAEKNYGYVCNTCLTYFIMANNADVYHCVTCGSTDIEVHDEKLVEVTKA